MSITLDSLTIPYDFLWLDEFAYTGVQMSARYSLGGIQHIEHSAIADGAARPITLGGPDAWIERADLVILRSWAAVPGKTMTLTLHDGRSFSVMFRHWDAPVIEAESIKNVANPEDTDYYMATLKLVTV